MRISDWSSDVCSSDLQIARQPSATALGQDVHWNSAARGSRGTRMSQESIPPAVDYSRVFSQAIDRLHTEGRYRVFIAILRNKGAFPHARCFAGHNGPKPITVWFSNDYLSMCQHPDVNELGKASWWENGCR